MLPNILNCKTLRRIWVEDQVYQVFGVIAQETRQLVISFQNLLVQLLRILVLKGQVAADHRVQDDTAAPYVGTEAQVPLTLDHFWRCVAWTTASCLEPLAVLVKIAEAEIDYFNVIIMIKKQVLGLQIPMHNAQLMNVLNTRNQLLIHLGCLIFF